MHLPPVVEEKSEAVLAGVVDVTGDPSIRLIDTAGGWCRFGSLGRYGARRLKGILQTTVHDLQGMHIFVRGG